MNSSVPLDCAFFQLSPRRTRCELFVSANGKTEKLASGVLKPFLTHLKVAEEQASHDVHLINLEVGRRKNAAKWFNKGTVERFVRFVSTPEVLELVNSFDSEMSQLEGARKMYSQGARDQLSGENESKSAAATDATKKELLRAIDVRLLAVKQDLATSCARASAAGFNLESVSELLLFADQFGAIRLSEACKSFLSLPRRRPELIMHQQSLPSPAIHPQWKSFNDANARSSSGSDMSIDEQEVEQADPARSATFHCGDAQLHSPSPHIQQQQAVGETTAAIIEQQKPESQHFVEKEMEKVDDPASTSVSSAKSAQQAGGGSKRLTVQDRINLFESKQKEQSANPNVGGGSFGGPIVSRLAGTRGEHRRNPSDVSVEKLVLRRWSGASDMSIDLNSNSNNSIDRKESGSTAGTPTSSANSQHQIISRNSENDDCGLIEASKSYSRLSSKKSSKNSLATNSSSTFSSSQDHDRTFSKDETHTRDAVHKKVIASASMEPPGLTKEEQLNTWTHMSCSLDGMEHGGMRDQVASQSRTKGFSNSTEVVISRELAAPQSNFRSASEDLVNDQMVSQIPSRASLALSVPSEPEDQVILLAQPRDQIEVDDIAVKVQPTSVNQFSSFTGKMEDTGPKFMGASDSQIQLKPFMGKMEDMSAKGDSANPETNGSGFNEELVARDTTLTALQVPSKVYSAKARQDSASMGLKFSGKTSVTDKKFRGRRAEIVPTEISSAQSLQSRKINEGMEIPSFLLEESQTARPNKDNHEFNDVLHLKAEELEKLFAEHKLKNYGDQIASARRKNALGDLATKSVEKRSAQSPPKQKPEKSLLRQDSSSGVEFVSDLLPGMIEKIDLCDNKMQMIGNNPPTDIPRGKLYGKYMQRRDAKLSQESGSKRAHKEAKMKAMHDSLELSQAELKTRFAGHSDGHNLTDARRRAEKMRSFNACSTLKVKDQTSESLTGDGNVDDQELSASSTGNQSNKLALTSVSPTPKHLVKSTNSNSLRHRGQSENSVAQSVPTFPDLKNENIKPLAVVAKATSRGQPRSFARSKSSIEDAEISKEDRSRWSNTMRKNTVIPTEFKDLSSLNSEKTLHYSQISGEFKQYLKKGNGVSHDSGAVMGKSRSSITPESKNKEKSEEIVSQKEVSLDMAIDDEEFESAYAEGNNLIMDHPIDSYGEKPRHSQVSGEPESENGDLIRPPSHLDDSIINFSKFNSPRNAEDSAEESSESLNSHIYHSLSYTREGSDIYESSDFTTDCTSWNSHSLSQIMDSEAARMRKKWGSAQIPVISVSASQQSRRDVTKGFKRLLKFGRKSRGADYLVNDWFSASTASEGDDDPEDGRDIVQRPSDDLRKSRMGYSSTYDGFNDGDIFPEQAQSLHNSTITNPPTSFRLRDDHLSGSSLKAPRSFFSLSSFRSKAGDSKPR